MPHNRRILPTILLALLLPTLAGAIPVMLKQVLRRAVIQARCGVVGHVVATAPWDSQGPGRSSTLVVDEVVFGPVTAGDSLVVHWRANRWHDISGFRVEVACGGDTQLDTLQGKSRLWILKTDRDGNLRCAVWPLEIEDLTPDRHARLLSALDPDPDTADALTTRLLDQPWNRQATPAQLANVAAVREFLERHHPR